MSTFQPITECIRFLRRQFNFMLTSQKGEYKNTAYNQGRKKIYLDLFLALFFDYLQKAQVEHCSKRSTLYVL